MFERLVVLKLFDCQVFYSHIVFFFFFFLRYSKALKPCLIYFFSLIFTLFYFWCKYLRGSSNILWSNLRQFIYIYHQPSQRRPRFRSNVIEQSIK